MSRSSNLLENRTRILTPFVAFGLCLALTVGASFFAFESAKVENAGRFERAIGAFNDTLRSRMTVYTNALIYTRNLFHVKPDLREDEFNRFVQEMALRENFPGIQTLGFIERMNSGGVEKDIVRYVSVLNSGTTVSVKGVDLGVSPQRKEAMNDARDSGEPAASDRVNPMPAANANPTAYAFLLFVPLYRPNMPVATVEERRAALRGFVYSGFRAANLFGRITEDARFRKADFIVRIYDGAGIKPETLMFSEGPEKIENALMSRDFSFKFADHEWTLRVVAPQSYSVAALRWLPGLVFSLGLLLSVALALALRRSQALSERLREANRAKSIFLANISHEIRTPLGVMLGFSELAMTQKSEEERAESLRTVVRNGRELTRIIGDVLDVSKIEAQTLQLEESAFSLRQMISDVVQIWQPPIESKGVKFNADVPADLPMFVKSDETRIKQVLTNLFSNAHKFTEKGEVRLSVRSTPLSEAHVTLSFKVTDTGIGVSREQRDRLFMPFSQGDSSITRKFGGSGLGLALSRSIAETLGGELTLDADGQGSEFLFSFPTKLADSLAPIVSASKATLKGRRVLLVDDSPDNRALVSMMLKKAEAEVDVAVDGDDGVKKALARPYDLILMDIQMPNKDGYTALRELKASHSKVPVIALTAHALREERERALSEGFAGYITKPVDRDTLVRISAETLG